MSRSPSPEEARRAVEEAAAGASDPWAEPLPLTVARNLPPFPVGALPDWGAAMVEAVSEETQTPPDLAGVVFLGVLSAAAGGHALVEVQTSWIEPVNLYAAPAMAPGSRKSAVFRIMTAPILGAERALQDQARNDIHESQVSLEVAQEAARRAVQEAAKKGTDDAQAAAMAAKELANSITVLSGSARPRPRPPPEAARLRRAMRSTQRSMAHTTHTTHTTWVRGEVAWVLWVLFTIQTGDDPPCSDASAATRAAHPGAPSSARRRRTTAACTAPAASSGAPTARSSSAAEETSGDCLRREP